MGKDPNRRQKPAHRVGLNVVKTTRELINEALRESTACSEARAKQKDSKRVCTADSLLTYNLRTIQELSELGPGRARPRRLGGSRV